MLTDKQWKATLDLIKKFHVPQLLIGEVLGLQKSVISEKMNPKKPDKFSEIQKKKIHDYLLAMGKILVNSLDKK